MPEKKVIAVVGATGAQGGGLVQAILKDAQGGFAARAITRDANSAKAKALGKEVRYNAVSPEAYRGFGFPGAEDLGNMFQFYAEFEEYVCGARSVEVSRSLNPQLQSFADWLARNKDRIPLA